MVQELAYDMPAWFRAPSTAFTRGVAGLAKDRGEDDCDSLAIFAEAMAGFIADGPYARNQFIRAFGVLTPARFPITTIVPLVRTSSEQDVVYLQRSGAGSGYSSQFQNTGSTGEDQGHHFAAFLQVGYWYGLQLGSAAADWFERLQGTPNNEGDRALGRIAVSFGTAIRSGTLRPGDLGNRIRDEICAH
jgi:hypothetical protein